MQESLIAVKGNDTIICPWCFLSLPKDEKEGYVMRSTAIDLDEYCESCQLEYNSAHQTWCWPLEGANENKESV